MDDNGDGVGVKELDPKALQKTVRDLPPKPPEGSTGVDMSMLWWVSSIATEITEWGKHPKLRDRQLREFVRSESYYQSAQGVVCSRNASFSWTLDGPPRVVNRLQNVLDNADDGEGWTDLMLKVSQDLYSQDYGAFIEVVRDGNSPDSALLALNHLDAARCWHTGNPEVPVIYQDRLGKYHQLPWYNVITLAEMPSTIELPGLYGLQICALSRMLWAAQIIKAITLYKYEKVAGRRTRAMHIVNGLTQVQINDALAKARAFADSQGSVHYIDPLIIPTNDPKAEVSSITLEFASLPDGYDENDSFKNYITIIAMAFLSDYQEFAPLPGGGLGTSAQSEMLHLKTRGKGPALFKKIVLHALNHKILPKNVEFAWEEKDPEAEKQTADVKKVRADTRALMVQSGEITADASRQLALDDGDISQEIFDSLGGRDVTPDVKITDEEQPKTEKPETPVLPAAVPAVPMEEAQKEDEFYPSPFWKRLWQSYP